MHFSTQTPAALSIPQAHSPSAALCVLFAAVYLLAGVLGHDPWKQDEAYTFGMVLHILQTGDWVVPTLGGEPFMEKPPLFYILAAFSAAAFADWLPLHDGARLAATFSVAVGLGATAAAARLLFGRSAASSSVLIVLSCIGMIVHAHEMITDTLLFAGFAIAILGLAVAMNRPVLGGVLLGTGAGIGFMAKGLVAPAMMGVTIVALPLLSRYWRSREYARAVVAACGAALPFVLIWPTALYLRGPDAFETWLWTNNFGRFSGSASLGADTEPWYYTRTLLWFAFPALPLAAVTVWQRLRGHRLAFDPPLLLLLTIVCAMIGVLGTAATARSLYALPLLIPLSILGSQALPSLARVTRAVSVASAVMFAVFSALIWTIWALGIRQGVAPDVPVLSRYLPEGFPFPLMPGLVMAAMCCTALWIFSWRSRRAAIGPLHRWVAGMTMVWGTAMSLLLPWIDHAKSFRAPFSAISAVVPEEECVASRALGEPQRGMLHYIAGIIPFPVSPGHEVECNYLLVQTNHDHERNVPAPPGWSPIWSGARDGERNESFTLFVSDDAIASFISEDNLDWVGSPLPLTPDEHAADS